MRFASPRLRRLRSVLGLVGALLLLAPTACGKATESPTTAKRPVLLTGFEPFGGRDVNESWEAVKVLDGTTVRGRNVVALRLPVVYDGVKEPLEEAIARWHPVAVISFGVGSPVVQIERVAENGYHPARPPDNAGRPPPRDKIDPAGPARQDTGLPIEAIMRALTAAKIQARPSSDAGGYLCNECFYRVMSAVPPEGFPLRARGFVHVPPVGRPNSLGGTYDMEVLRRAVVEVVDATVAGLDEKEP